MRILLTGSQGQVGWELQRALSLMGEVVALHRGQCDLSDADGLRRVVQAAAPQVIVNAAAYTAVDKAESEPDPVFAVNSDAPGILAQEAKRLGALLIHYSTDYVFNGEGDRPWRENDPVAPQSVYGVSKLMGEQAIRAAGASSLIFRTSWVFGVHGNNFLKTMLKAAATREELRVVADQIGVPTPAHLIADVTGHALQSMRSKGLLGGVREEPAIYHLAPSGETNWHAYACFAIAYARQLDWPIKTKTIVPIATRDWPMPAARPANSRLDCRKLQSDFGLYLPDWECGARRVIEQLLLESLH